MYAVYIGKSHCSLRLVICGTALRLFFSTRRHCPSLESGKNVKCHQNDFFLSFASKPEVHSSSEMFVITKWKNHVLYCLAYLVQIK